MSAQFIVFYPVFAVIDWFGAVMIIMGVIGVVGFSINFANALSSMGWPIAKGVVVDSSIIESGLKSRPNYTAGVKYEFFVGQVKYTGDTVGYLRLEGPRHVALSVVDRYPVAAKVDVYYCPRDPRKSTLEVGFEKYVYLFMLIPIVMIAAGVYDLIE